MASRRCKIIACYAAGVVISLSLLPLVLVTSPMMQLTFARMDSRALTDLEMIESVSAKLVSTRWFEPDDPELFSHWLVAESTARLAAVVAAWIGSIAVLDRKVRRLRIEVQHDTSSPPGAASGKA